MEFVVVFLLAIYLLPWVAAESLDHPRSGWILTLVLLLGWTGIGWIAALVWVLASPPPVKRRGPLTLVRAPAESPGRKLLRRLDRRPVGLACGALVALTGGLAALGTVAPAPRVPDSGAARPARAQVELRMGPGESWPSAGTVRAPCRFEVVERKGAWRHVWRLGECDTRMTGRSGWARMEDLRHADGSGD
jgi:hypothetical protein